MANRKDVAKEANVSTTAVSYFTNGNGYLSQEKRERIEAAIKKLNYRPNPVAKNLKMKDSKQLALLFNSFSNPYHSQLANAAMVTAKEQGYTTLVGNYVDDDYVLELCSYMIGGILICTYGVSEEAVAKITDMGIPVVILGSLECNYNNSLVSQITFDYSESLKEICNHMIALGKNQICYVADDVGIQPSQYSDNKTEIFDEICREEKLSVSMEKILIPAHDPDSTKKIVKSRFGKRGKKPELLLCSNNSIALVLLSSLSDLNISVPEQVEVVAFDDTAFSRICVPKLTVVDLDSTYIGKMATEFLIKKCQKEKVYDVKITPKLIYRETTLAK